MKQSTSNTKGLSTIALHAGYSPSADDGAITPPLHLTTTFRFGNNGGHHDGSEPLEQWRAKNKFRFNNDYEHYDYSRTANPTRMLLEQVIAELDGNDFGLAYSSGSAALANVVAMLEPGKSVLFSSDAYGGTYRFIVRVAGAQGIGYKIADLTDAEGAEQALKAGDIGIVWLETPTNPLLKVTDIARLAGQAHQHGALLVVDNTFATPVLQRPAELGADIVAYSTSKYLNGHADVIGGALTTSNPELYTKLKFLQNSIGAVMSPFDSWLTLRGLRTLELRVERQTATAQQVAAMLAAHDKVAKVYYPGHFSGEQGAVVKRQMRGPGAMISVELDARYDAQDFLRRLAYFPLAESLGGVESLIDHPASMTHSAIPPEERKKIGLSDGLFRISVGIENAQDLLGDLEQALAGIK
ncbi:MAG TPA: PLP-dependent aspartate aminotransferase family protein [Candidatus Saccharimonadia bacterium]|jgi:cystathionine beta-lyase/cystathionine gamma-synthase|nr:PLP-dependent aspartate aminotransferase family protein [Candidatus Saccharimonadia bacterium]